MSPPIIHKKLRRFNPFILEHKRINGHAPIMVFIGKRGTGKSTMIADIISHLKVKSAIVMSGTEEANGFYSKHIHPLHIYGEYSGDKIQTIIDTQKRKAQILKKQFGDDVKLADYPDLGILIIMDDLAYDGSMMKDPALKEIFFNGRHYGITLVMSFQYMVGIPPAYRSNIDFVFVGREVTREHMDKLHKYFFGIYPKAEEFRAAFTKYTEDFSYMILDKTCISDDITNNVFWYRAQMNKEFRIGTPEEWRIWTYKLKKNR